MVQRRNFLYYATGAVAAGVTGTAIWGLGCAMDPTAATQHDSNLYVDISTHPAAHAKALPHITSISRGTNETAQL
ncbi:twin-arginine translocation signal domain-containing protein [Rhodobacteraceae bacterium MYP1-1]|uniref:Twin-arginine translocation signal domain-containing protein n=2 Tax=Halocynthiibacter styelae TaxID=2761955 RepID=A0A8J7IUZ2_9RHOB|nr:twin-arginine translocation signal domain-containing protein [Paenihalocynthiibacter styelae]